MKPSILLLFPLSVFLFTGCELSTTSGDDLLADVESALNEAGITQEQIDQELANATNDANPTPASNQQGDTVVATGAIPSGICCGFLWKPHSESTGSLVILTPPQTRGRTQQIATISGAFGTESAPMRHEHHNGGRPHFYFDRHGREYGTNITVNVPLTDGSVYTVVIPDGALRWE